MSDPHRMPRPGRKTRAIPLTLTPAEGMAWDAGARCWRIDALPARLALTSTVDFRQGWFCLEGRLVAMGWHRGAWLHLEGADASLRVDLPLTKQGWLKEVVYVPHGVRRLLLQPMNSLGYVRVQELTIRPIGRAARTAMMAGRIVVTLLTQPRWRLKALGLDGATTLSDFTRAYRLAGSLFAEAPALDYHDWLQRHHALTRPDRVAIERELAALPPNASFRMVIYGSPGADQDAQNQTDAALAEQLLAPTRTVRLQSLAELAAAGCEVHSPVESSKTIPAGTPAAASTSAPDCGGGQDHEAIPAIESRWIFLLPEGAILAPHALYWFARHVERRSRLAFVYCDHDRVNRNGSRHDPVFKPDWCPELLRSTNYIGPAAAIRAEVLARTLDPTSSSHTPVAGTHDLWLRITEALHDDQIGHIPAPLLTLPEHLRPDVVHRSSVSAVAAHLARLEIPATVEPNGHGDCRVRYALPTHRPFVSIIVPTRDRLALLRRCVDSVLGNTSYRDFELLIVDNGSEQATTLDYLETMATHPQVRQLRDARPFNFSALNNVAARAAHGDYLCLLNNDTEVITPDWLEEMVSRLSQHRVGAVGAKLLYDDGRIQHAGDVIGVGGCANHLHQYLPGDEPGYQHRAILAQDLSAVTGACLLTRRDLYLALGGLNEKSLPVTFNDVDYCLRLRAAGWRVVWTPYARLYHHESATRGRDVSPTQRARADREAAYMRRRWKRLMLHDPYYNPNLSYNRQDFSLSHAPWIERPWR